MSMVSVDFSDKIGKINPLHGVNSGPRTYCFYMNTSEYFKEAGIPYSRLHDTEYPFGSGHFVDIHCIFPKFSADVEDPASYDFAMTDEYIKAIQEVGTETFYRLGITIEHTPAKKYSFPPEDFDKWARICEHIVRHYNEGWKDGFRFGLKYWEVWNEPEECDGKRTSMWNGTPEQYYELYCITAKHLKACFGDSIKVGGYGACGHRAPSSAGDVVDDYNSNYTDNFFRYVKANNAPLDFYSWHLYSMTVNDFRANAAVARETMRRFGFGNAESICTEWNFGHGVETFKPMTTEVGASAYAAYMIVFQEEGVSVATYYDAQPAMTYCGIFDHGDQKPTKSFYALKGWNELYKLKNRVNTICYAKDQYACAATNDDEAAILFSAYEAQKGAVTFDITGFTGENGIIVETYAVTKDTVKCDLISTDKLTGKSFKLIKKSDDHTVFILKLKKW